MKKNANNLKVFALRVNSAKWIYSIDKEKSGTFFRNTAIRIKCDHVCVYECQNVPDPMFLPHSKFSLLSIDLQKIVNKCCTFTGLTDWLEFYAWMYEKNVQKRKKCVCVCVCERERARKWKIVKYLILVFKWNFSRSLSAMKMRKESNETIQHFCTHSLVAQVRWSIRWGKQ